MQKTNLYMGKGHLLKSCYTVYDKCVIDCGQMKILENENEIGNTNIWLENFRLEKSIRRCSVYFFKKAVN